MYDHSFRLEPGWRYLDEEALRIDQEIAEQEPCPRCGGQMVYRPWLVRPERSEGYDLSSHTYVAEAVCTCCGHVIEF